MRQQSTKVDSEAFPEFHFVRNSGLLFATAVIITASVSWPAVALEDEDRVAEESVFQGIPVVGNLLRSVPEQWAKMMQDVADSLSDSSVSTSFDF